MKSLALLTAALAVTACAPIGGSSAPERCRVVNPAVQLDCREEAGGRLSGCRVLGENPPDCGFGDFALELSQVGRFEAGSMEDVSRDAGRVRFTLRYRSAP